MINLDSKVFGNFTKKEIIGETPKNLTPEKFENQLNRMLENLESKNTSELKEILESSKKIRNHLGSITGAMALDQKKIKLCIDFLSKYIKELESRLAKN